MDHDDVPGFRADHSSVSGLPAKAHFVRSMVGIDVAAADRTLSAAVGHGVAFRDRTGHIGTGKLIKIVAVALSDEHIFSLEGGRANKTGQPVRGAGGYGLNRKASRTAR